MAEPTTEEIIKKLVKQVKEHIAMQRNSNEIATLMYSANGLLQIVDEMPSTSKDAQYRETLKRPLLLALEKDMENVFYGLIIEEFAYIPPEIIAGEIRQRVTRAMSKKWKEAQCLTKEDIKINKAKRIISKAAFKMLRAEHSKRDAEERILVMETKVISIEKMLVNAKGMKWEAEEKIKIADNKIQILESKIMKLKTEKKKLLDELDLHETSVNVIKKPAAY